MQSLPMSAETAIAVIEVFHRTYTAADGTFVNKVGREAPQRTIDLVAQAQSVLA
jgi:hypothetical protein